MGLLAGLLGSFILVATAFFTLPFCDAWSLKAHGRLLGGLTAWGALGSVLDSLLGGWFQASVVDTHSGRVIEGEGGGKVLVSSGTGVNTLHYQKKAEMKARMGRGEGKGAVPVVSGQDVLDDNGVGVGGKERPSRVVESGKGWLDNNQVNALMISIMSIGGMLGARWVWAV